MLAADGVVTGDGYLGHLAGALGCRRLAVLAPPMGDWCWGMPGTAAPWYHDLPRYADAARPGLGGGASRPGQGGRQLGGGLRGFSVQTFPV